MNTPLGVAITATSVMKEEGQVLARAVRTGQLTEESLQQFIQNHQNSLDVLERSLTRVVHLTNSFKKIALDQGQSQRRQFYLSEVLDELVLCHQKELNKRAIEITLTGTDDIVMHSFPGALTEVLNHLLNNALRHGFKKAELPAIHIVCSLIDDKLRLEFRDNGCGIEEKYLNKLFDPFFTTQMGQGSSGLGLSFVYNIVTGVLGGEIEITSEHGCCCQLMLPLTAPETEEDQPETA